jgi:hypothetical protein
VNGDGIGDVIIGAQRSESNGHTNAGKTYIVFGRRTGFPPTFELTSLYAQNGGDGSAGVVLKGVGNSDGSGCSVSSAGDVNGDGIDDVIIGASGASPNGQLYAGESYVVFGRRTGFPAELELSSLFPIAGGDGSTGVVLKGVDARDSSGSSVSNAGDLNGDGIADVIVGARGADPIGRDLAGESYVIFGRTTGFPASFELLRLLPPVGGDGGAGFVLRGAHASDQSGWSVSNAGDVNGDGIDDIVLGALYADASGQRNSGESYVVFGRTSGFSAAFDLRKLFPAAGDSSAGFVIEGVAAGDESGSSVSSAGDINGDGIDDVVIGAGPANANGRSHTGQSYVVFGRTASFPAPLELSSLFPDAGGDGSAGFVLSGIDEGDYSGISVSGAGDVNGDGIDDLIIGAFLGDPGGRIDAGESYVVFGRATGFPAVFELRSLLPH